MSVFLGILLLDGARDLGYRAYFWPGSGWSLLGPNKSVSSLLQRLGAEHMNFQRFLQIRQAFHPSKHAGVGG
jgi:hypothetical protein